MASQDYSNIDGDFIGTQFGLTNSSVAAAELNKISQFLRNPITTDKPLEHQTESSQQTEPHANLQNAQRVQFNGAPISSSTQAPVNLPYPRHIVPPCGPLYRGIKAIRAELIPLMDTSARMFLYCIGQRAFVDAVYLVALSIRPSETEKLGHARNFKLFYDTFEQAKIGLLTADDNAFFVIDKSEFENDPNFIAALRRANLVTFVAAVLGISRIGFFDLNESFIDVFLGLYGGKLTKRLGLLYLELKTQAFIAARDQTPDNYESLLDELFPDRMGIEHISLSESFSRDLGSAESDFISQCQKRKEALKSLVEAEATKDHASEDAAKDAIGKELRTKYPWKDFVRIVLDMVSGNLQILLGSNPLMQIYFPNTHSPLIGDQSPNLDNDSIGFQQPSLVTETMASPVPLPISPNGLPRTHTPQRRPKSRYALGTGSRKHWTKEEEDVLVAAVIEVRGPHWSQILALHGPGGTKSEILKDRNQVQLKDKARNIKMSYLRNKAPLPPFFDAVTGDLRRHRNADPDAHTTSSPAHYGSEANSRMSKEPSIPSGSDGSIAANPTDSSPPASDSVPTSAAVSNPVVVPNSAPASLVSNTDIPTNPPEPTSAAAPNQNSVHVASNASTDDPPIDPVFASESH
ncbi:hypothetical protein CANCADRAFT_31808 [Tortispora caseinolytica NRRL Y-17796]|uniref:Myb-like domain-containing protein n=1 Tax=Tortispora caseinolytica NRRL Y-17796 TaxID=767744 RepID=A0A1E4TGY8_9ASCO|nr:hypothetical protein CANCADRAFT_31808 [Tortispora caseinolytica NRRL Y-17796]